MEQRPNAKNILQMMIEFSNLGIEKGINNYVISGPIIPKRHMVLSAAGLFPALSSKEQGFAIVSAVPTEAKKMAEYHRRILSLSLDQRIIDLNILDNPSLRGALSLYCFINGYPTSAILFGKYEDTDVEVVALYTIQGISPQTALKEFHERSRKKLMSFN